MSMNFLLIFPHYISWHYTKALADMVYLFKSFMLFFWNLFSIKILLQTLFVPFQKLSAKPTKRFDLEDFFSALVTTLLMRFIGFVIRTFFIILGILSLLFFTIFYSIFFIVWLIAPVFLVGMFILGFIAMFKIPQL